MIDALRRVRRRRSGTRLWTCCAGRAGTRIRSEALHRILTSGRPAADRAWERVPTIPSASPHQIVKPRGLFAEAGSIRPRNGYLSAMQAKSLGLPDIRQAFLFGNIVILTLTWITNATARMIINAKQDLPMKSVKKSTLFHLIVELTIYAVFVSVYLILVLHFLLDWLKELFTKQREVYAYVSILLMIGQAVGLERLTSSLVHLTRRRTE